MNKLEDFVTGIWNHDFTLWKESPEEITNRLGWLDFDKEYQDKLRLIDTEVEKIIKDGFETAVLIGMGGSSLAPLVFSKTFTREDGFLNLLILDSTDPDFLTQIKDELDFEKTLFIVSSKSGSTIEVFSIFKYFYRLAVERMDKQRAGKSFVAITDPNSGLEKIAIDCDFRLILLNDPNIGGRYSALSYFGLFPAALLGIDLNKIIERASIEKENSKGKEFRSHWDFLELANYRKLYKEEIGMNFPVSLGSYIGNEALSGRDKLTFIMSDGINTFGQWLEQLIAESTGKEGKGVLPVASETPGPTRFYGNDRIFVKMTLAGDKSLDKIALELKKTGHAVIEIELNDKYDLGGQIFLWEMATAAMCHILQVNPFDQPNVEKSKILARNLLNPGTLQSQPMVVDNNIYGGNGTIEEEKQFIDGKLIERLYKIIEDRREGDYFALQCFIKESDETSGLLAKLSSKIRELTKCPVTIGYGPRYLHSTGQLHKGDRGNGIFIQLKSIKHTDMHIPELENILGKAEGMSLVETITFGQLISAQAKGDEMALREEERRAMIINLGEDIASGLEELIASLNNNKHK
ncbi:MAG: hypothetical protein WCF96_06680 [Eubacteriales bacterium]